MQVVSFEDQALVPALLLRRIMSCRLPACRGDQLPLLECAERDQPDVNREDGG